MIYPIDLMDRVLASFPEEAVTSSKISKKISFNLLKYLKKDLHGYDEISTIVSALPEEEKFVGCLPDIWRKHFGINELKDKTLEVFTAFSNFVKEWQQPKYSLGNHACVFEKLENVLNKILNQKTKVGYVGMGQFGSVVKIDSAGEKFALKAFRVPSIDSIVYSAYKNHGQVMEIPNALAVNHSLKPSQRARFYCGKVTEIGKDDGFMLSEFVEKNPFGADFEKPFSLRELLTYNRFSFEDNITIGNVINGKVVDFGKVKRNFENKEQEKFAKKLLGLICRGDTEKIKFLKEKYKNNLDFEKVVDICKQKLTQIFVSYEDPSLLKRNNNDIISLLRSAKVLDVDFSELPKYKHCFSPENVDMLKKMGILQ